MKRPTGTLTLTTLPDIAIDEILTRLPIKDAVRTSVLSSAWLRRWHSIPALDLSGLPVNIISQLLLHHSSPVRVFCAQLKKKKNKPFPIYCWLSTLSLCSASTLRSLTLSFDGPLSINSVARYFPNLAHLHLSCQLSISPDCFSGIPISPDCFSGIPNLRTLHLEGFCTKPSLLVSKFPLLEKLILENMDIMSEGENWDIVQESGIDIVTPNLRWLQLLDLRLDKITITNAPLLETLIVSGCFDDRIQQASSLVEVLAGAPRIKRLEVDCRILGAWARDLNQAAGGKMPMSIPIVMEHLKVISLSVLFTSKKQIALALCLLRSTPNLQQLEIRGCIDYYLSKHISELEYRAGKDFWEAQEHVDVFGWLERVKMTEIHGIKSELDFIHFVLVKARMLKAMMVTFRRSIKNKDWLKTKLLGFPRASNQARILLTDEAEADESEEWG